MLLIYLNNEIKIIYICILSSKKCESYWRGDCMAIVIVGGTENITRKIMKDLFLDKLAYSSINGIFYGIFNF